MTRIDRRALFASGAAAALLAATGVSAAPRRGGTLRVALSGLDHACSWDAPGQGRFMQIVRQGAVLDGLTEIAADGTLRGELATAWEADADARTWRFDLREGVTFHDGEPLRADDVVAALATHVAAADAEGGRVVLRLDAPDPNLPYRLAGPDYVIPPADADRRAAGVGTGLYAVHKCDPGRHFIGTRVSRHWKDGTAGWAERVEFVAIPAEDVRAQALREGLVDAAELGAPDALMDMAEFVALPGRGTTQQIVRRGIGIPAQVGGHWPLDNLRMAERWWVA